MATAKEIVPKSLTKAQIIAQLAEKNALTKKQVAAFLESFVDLAYREAGVDDHVISHRHLAKELEGHPPPHPAGFDHTVPIVRNFQHPHGHRYAHAMNVLRGIRQVLPWTG